MCNLDSHKLLTNEEKSLLLQFLNQKLSFHNLSMTQVHEKTRELTDNNKLGGCFYELDQMYPNRLNIYEINHMPPTSCYDRTPYQRITCNRQPAILMNIKDHRAHVTTGQKNFSKGYDFDTKSELREYMKDELMQNDFYEALRADIEFLFRDKDFTAKYYKGVVQMIEYCNNSVKDAPCNCQKK